MILWMKNKGLVLFLVLAGLFSSSGLALAAKEPMIQFQEEKWDFGKVKQGDILSHEFVFKNVGEAPLSILRVRTSCGCTAALVSEKKIEPGKEGRIKVTFNSGGYAEKIVKSIYVDSDDPNRSNLELLVSAEIEVPPKPKIKVDPYNLDLGLLLEGEELRGKVTIKNEGELELSVDSAREKATFLRAGKPLSFPLKLASGKSVEVELRIPSQNRTGLIREYVLLHSNDPVSSTISLYLSGYVVTKKELKELFAKYRNILD